MENKNKYNIYQVIKYNEHNIRIHSLNKTQLDCRYFNYFNKDTFRPHA